MTPIFFYYKAGNPYMQERGRALLKQGVLGCLVLAGGEGTRLGWEGPKGTYPISVCEKKSLFQLVCEKVKAAKVRDGGVQVPLAVMTSPENSQATHDFFARHGNFGLSEDELSFFEQGTLPLLDLEKRPMPLRASDGNGYCLKYLMESGIYDAWKARGIKFVYILPVDNPLGDPLDEELLGVHASENLDWTVKCIERKNRHEKAGVLVERDGKLQIIEYSELPSEIGPEFTLLNTGMHCVSMDLIARLKPNIPLHLAKKKREGHWYFKQEAFIFDLMPQAARAAALLYDRAHIYAPLKNSEGESSPETVRQALQARDRLCIEAITGKKAPERPFELDPAFYYPTEELLEHWRGRDLPTTCYIIYLKPVSIRHI